MRIYLGFLLSPVLPCLALSLILGGMFFPFVLFFSLAVCYMVIMALAVPAYVYLRRRKRVGVVDSVLSGAALGCLTGTIPALLEMFSNMQGYSAGDSGGNTIISGHHTWHGYMAMMNTIGGMGFLGAAIGFFFWVFALSPACNHCPMNRLEKHF